MPSVGHSPGHTSVMIQSRGERAMTTGDFVGHPCQMAHPKWSSKVDYDSKQAEVTQMQILRGLAGEPVLTTVTHFSAATAGHVARDGDAFRLDV